MFSRYGVIAFGFAALMLVLPITPAQAQVTITQAQKLQFGKWFFGGNSTPSTITVTPMGGVSSSDPSIAMIAAPKPGIYNISGLDPFTEITDVIVLVTTDVQLGAEEFTLTNFTTSVPDADGLGNTQLRIGADLVTSGDSNPYPGGTYDGEISIEIVY